VHLHIKQVADNSGFGSNKYGVRLESASGPYWGIQTPSAGDLIFDSGTGSGYAYITKNSGSFNITSDARLKKNVHSLENTLERVNQLRPGNLPIQERTGRQPTGGGLHRPGGAATVSGCGG
jgi:hypothetical protein